MKIWIWNVFGTKILKENDLKTYLNTVAFDWELFGSGCGKFVVQIHAELFENRYLKHKQIIWNFQVQKTIFGKTKISGMIPYPFIVQTNSWDSRNSRRLFTKIVRILRILNFDFLNEFR